jgi:glycosyltransferase involved in cell wall biosynthesis
MNQDSDLRLLNILAGAPVGGAETFFVTLTKAFQAAGVEQRAVIRENPDRAGQLRAADVTVDEARFGSLFDVRTELKLDKIVREFRPTVVLSYMERASSFMPKGPHLKLARLGGYYKLKYFRRCDHLLCITNDIRRHVIAEGWPEDRAHYMPNFAEVTGTPVIARAELDTPDGAPVIFTPGRLHKVKGLDTLITSIKSVPDAYLWIAGDGPERESLIAHAAGEGVSDRVRFLGWRTDTGPFFRACDIVAFPSRHEPFGTVTLEAWAYGKPLVVTDAQGPVEVVRPDEDGVMVPKDDPAALAAGFNRVLADPALARSLVERGAARHRAEFTEAACVARYLDLFRTLS